MSLARLSVAIGLGLHITALTTLLLWLKRGWRMSWCPFMAVTILPAIIVVQTLWRRLSSTEAEYLYNIVLINKIGIDAQVADQ